MEQDPYRPPQSDVELPPPTQEGLPPLPWEIRERIGILPALWQTLVLFVQNPAHAYARARDSGDYASPVIYGLAIGTLGGVVGHLWGMLFNVGSLGLLGGLADENTLPMMGLMAGMGAVMMIFIPLLVLIGMFVSAALVHVSLLVTGGLPDSKGGFEGTLRSQAYASSTQVAVIVPLVGGLVAAIWAIVLNVIGLKRMHGISTGRALVGILLPMVACCVLIGTLIIMVGGLAMMSSR